jgi:hypothetical protein
MPYDPEELGLPSEETSDPVDLSNIMLLAAEGAALAHSARTQGATPPPQANASQVAAMRAAALRRAQAAREASPLDEIEHRLNLASYYRALLEQSLFEEADEFSAVVEQEVRNFIMSRLSELLGTNKPQPPVEVKLPFTEQEVKALRVFANVLLTRQPHAVAQAPTPAPVENPRPVDPPPPPPAQRAPKVRGAAGPRKPEVARVEQPQTGPRTRRAAAPRSAAPAQEPQEAPSAEPPARAAPPPGPGESPLAMPRGAALTAVTAHQSAQTIAGIDREIERQLDKRNAS